ncbi:MAG: hypothetical protein ABUS57_01180 [Pseudomonadota bacterium]
MRSIAAAGFGAATFLKQSNGPILKQSNGPIAAAIEMTGWDTHANEGADEGQLARNLAILDVPRSTR